MQDIHCARCPNTYGAIQGKTSICPACGHENALVPLPTVPFERAWVNPSTGRRIVGVLFILIGAVGAAFGFLVATIVLCFSLSPCGGPSQRQTMAGLTWMLGGLAFLSLGVYLQLKYRPWRARREQVQAH